MRIQRVATVATAALLGSFALTACSGSSGSADASGQISVSASASTSTSALPSASASAPASGSGGSTPVAAPSGGGSTAVPVAAPTGNSGGGTATCTTAQLAFAIGPDSGPQSVGDTTAAEVVELTNKGSASCAMRGFPGVDLHTNAGTISVARSKQAPQLVTLKPGSSALFNVNYPVNNTGGSGVRIETMVITPPNETHSHTLAWDQGTLPATDGSGPSLSVDPVVAFSG